MDASASTHVSRERHTFSKAERLCSRSRIGLLFAEGRSRASFPVKAIWLSADEPGPFPVRVAFAVPKSRFKRAVHRNRIKRQLREAWREAKPAVYAALERQHLELVLLYQGKRLPAYAELTAALAQILPVIVAEAQALANRSSPISSDSPKGHDAGKESEADDAREPNEP